jgi:hypothetical protein
MPIRPAVVLALGLALATHALSGCSADEDPAPHPQATAADSPVRLVGPDDADLVLYVSNQSFEDDNVRLELLIDGVTVVDGDFPVKGQHNWIRFPLSLSSGSHGLTAESDTGATLKESFQVPGDEARYAVVNYWADDEPPEIEWHFQTEPVSFG